MANSRFYSNVAQQTTLSGSVASGTTSLNVGATTGFPPNFPYTLAVDYGAATEELVSVTAAAGTTLTVTRGYGSTSAQSHSLGAIVRHVYDATDATDFRTHEAATAAVHGVTGTLVGTSDTQTLSNKTLTAPTVNAGALSGVFSGSPTFSGTVTFSGTLTGSSASLTGTWAGAPTLSGNVTFSGNPVFTGNQQSNQSAATNVVEAALVTGDTFDRWRVYADGKQEWGAGNAARDLTLHRSAAKILGVIGTMRAEPTDTAVDALAANLPSGTAGDLLNLRVNNSVQAAMGPDGAFRIYGGNAPTSYTPTWGNAGSATFASTSGYYWKLGKIVFVAIGGTLSGAGSGTTTPLTVTLPTSPDRSIRQTLTLHAETVTVKGGTGASTIRNGQAVTFAGGSGTVVDRLRVTDSDGDGDDNLFGADLKSNSILTIQGWYREA